MKRKDESSVGQMCELIDDMFWNTSTVYKCKLLNANTICWAYMCVEYAQAFRRQYALPCWAMVELVGQLRERSCWAKHRVASRIGSAGMKEHGHVLESEMTHVYKR